MSVTLVLAISITFLDAKTFMPLPDALVIYEKFPASREAACVARLTQAMRSGQPRGERFAGYKPHPNGQTLVCQPE